MPKLGKVVYTVRSSVPAQWDEEFSRWQREEHVPRLLLVPGYRATQGFARLERPHAFMNVWQIDSKAAFDSEARRRAAQTPWRERIAAIRKDHSVDFYAPLSGDGVVAGHVSMEPPSFLVRYDIALKVDAAESDAHAGIDSIVKSLASDPATSYIRTLGALGTPGELLLLHYLSERRAPLAIDCSWCERIEAAPFKSTKR